MIEYADEIETILRHFTKSPTFGNNNNADNKQAVCIFPHDSDQQLMTWTETMLWIDHLCVSSNSHTPAIIARPSRR